MSRRHPRLSECKNMNDLVRGGFARAWEPTTDTGFRAYATGRLFVPAADGRNLTSTNCVLTHPVPSGMQLSGTIISRITTLYAGNDAGGQYTMWALHSSGARTIDVSHNGGKTYVDTNAGASSDYHTNSAWDSGTTHTFIARWTNPSTLNYSLTVDGVTDTGRTGVALTLNPPDAFWVGSVGGAYWYVGYEGPIAFGASAITDAQRGELDTLLAAGMSGFGLFLWLRDRGYRGMRVLPLSGDSLAYEVR